MDPGTHVYRIQRLTANVFYTFFHILPPHSHSDVASNPNKVCICKGGVPDCNDREVNVSTHYPGESFNISAIAIGQFNGSAPAVVQTVINICTPKTSIVPQTICTTVGAEVHGN